ncbi:glutamate racemase [Candidatus Falkowbacteria bacterium]|jgi:glutamate racemase|nr:glutamate racemase [Candidatus Falkowbacteria bacterium]MBT5503183.1 glutamate racemase [Candidatus Falkowbacteria bacterium]MBT6574571.1 glutamate racemase [Candidatus Falkowbacteria bacterium]MBT7348483.1 glutamate racemase [Candidatus Falkowbacteria bacterium]MBT7500852.1 glutamate racemase [Candidatus Falkowbacteria bacterium]
MIGVFDSGLGGLTVLKEIKRSLPKYDYMYLGDTLHVPYGNRSDEAIFGLTRKACDYLFKNGCKLIIVACNTASAKALRRLQQEWLPGLVREIPDQVRNDEFNILGVVRPMAEYVAGLGCSKVGIIGTRGTVNSNIYVVELKGQGVRIQGQGRGKGSGSKVHELNIVQQACPLLVPLIEEGWMNEPETKVILEKYIQPLREQAVQVLVLACTHYPLLIEQIKQIMGPNCLVPNPGEIVAKSLKDYLKRHPEIDNDLSKNSQTKYLVTDLSDNFQETADKFFGEKIELHKIDTNILSCE